MQLAFPSVGGPTSVWSDANAKLFVGSSENKTLTSSIVALGASLALEVVAEEIELPEEEASLSGLGCELGQGFLYARPMGATALAKLLDQPSLDVGGTATSHAT